jgi:ribosomal protein RSM22 (predicted rRNA methylase)
MELPPALRHAVDQALAHVAVRDLAAAARVLSERYRGEVRDGAMHVAGDLAARAYLATRLPATYAAVSAAFAAVTQARPDYAPRAMLDIGSGPGTVLWAAAQIWPVADAVLIEKSEAMRGWGERLAAQAPVARIAWRDADIADGLPSGEAHELVVIAYVLNELAPQAADRLIAESWAATADTLVVVEPGTPAGWARILRARDMLLAAGAYPLAPCPHSSACPLSAPDWCHFSKRVARARAHRLAKGADVPWEDEKYSYVAVSRQPGLAAAARVIGPPKAARGRVRLKLCRRDGTAEETLLTRREGAAYRIARRLVWGDALPADAEQP